MATDEVASLVRNTKIIARMENAQINARVENSKIIGRLVRERGKTTPAIIPRSHISSRIQPVPAGLLNVERAQAIEALRSAGETIRSELLAKSDIQKNDDEKKSGLRGLSRTQSEDLLQVKGSVVDRLL